MRFWLMISAMFLAAWICPEAWDRSLPPPLMIFFIAVAVGGLVLDVLEFLHRIGVMKK